ncbi:MalY/PatB family protein [Cellulomonas soli]
MRTRTSVKWRQFPPDVLPAWVAEMDVMPPHEVVEAVTAAMVAGDTGYPHGTATAEAFAVFAAERWGWAVDVPAVHAVPDVMIGATEVLRLHLRAGDTVVISPPVYPPFTEFSRAAGFEVEAAHLGPDGRLDPDTLDAAFARARTGGRRAAYLLCNPHNPTGAAPTRAELATLGDLARAHGVRVVSDEIHGPITRPGTAYVPAATVIPDAIALVSASKAFHLAGLKAALAVPGPDAVDDLARLPETVNNGVSHVALVAQTAALRHGGPWLDALRVGIERNKQSFAADLGARVPGVRWDPTEATYFAWVDLRDAGLGDDPAETLLHRGRLAVNPGRTFDPASPTHVRVNLATNRDVLRQVVDRIAAARDSR